MRANYTYIMTQPAVLASFSILTLLSISELVATPRSDIKTLAELENIFSNHINQKIEARFGANHGLISQIQTLAQALQIDTRGRDLSQQIQLIFRDLELETVEGEGLAMSVRRALDTWKQKLRVEHDEIYGVDNNSPELAQDIRFEKLFNASWTLQRESTRRKLATLSVSERFNRIARQCLDLDIRRGTVWEKLSAVEEYLGIDVEITDEGTSTLFFEKLERAENLLDNRLYIEKKLEFSRDKELLKAAYLTELFEDLSLIED